MVKKDDKIEVITTGEDGTAVFTADLPINYGYYIKEVQAPDNYYRNSEDVYAFRFDYTNQNEAEVQFTHTFANERVDAEIQLIKVDKETGKAQGDAKLSGAVYGLYARTDIVHPDGATGVLYKAGTQVASMTTDEEGKATVILVICNIVFLVKLNGGVGAYLASFSIAYGIAGLVAFFMSKEYMYFSLKKGNTQQLKKMLRYSVPSIPNMISWWINSVSDRYILLLFWDANVVGLYTAASKLPAMINLVSSIFQQAWQYSTAKEIESRDQKGFFSSVLRGYLYICVCTCGGLILINRLICKILLKTEFYDAWKFVPLLLIAAMFGCISTYFGTFYQALKKNTMLMISTMVGAIINIILNFALIPFCGGLGAALATVVSYIAVTVIRVIDIRKKIPLDIQWKRVFLQIFLVTVIMILESFVHNNLAWSFEILCLAIIVFSDFNLIKQVFNAFNLRNHK